MTKFPITHPRQALVAKYQKRAKSRASTSSLALFAVLALGFSICGFSARAERRVALVIGNAAYQNVEPLKTPTMDASRVADLLRTLDFSVTEVTDADKIAMEQALRRFSAEINGADVALFYFSGHGVQVGDLNYLVPTSAKVNNARSLPLDTIALQDVSSAMRHAGAKIQLLFLDACRNNPFANAFAARQADEAARGFAPVDTTTGSLVVFSTSPGKVALDGTGDVSPFTGGFLQYAAIPNLDVRQVLSRVRSYVATMTDNFQVPWDNSSLLGDFFLVPKRPPPIFEKLSQVELASDGSAQALRLPSPLQPEGGKIVVKIEKAPAYGRLVLDSRQLLAGDVLSPGDFTQIAYQSVSPQLVDSFSYQVNDAWGNSDVGLVSVTRRVGQAVGSTPAAANAPLALKINASAVSLVGLAPNLVFRHPLALPADSDARRLRLATAIPFGQLAVGSRVLEKDRTLSLADLKRLTFDAPVGSEGNHFETLFTANDGAGGEVKIAIDPQLTDCDRLAGDRLDAQGVAKGILAGQIDTAVALPACELAVKAQPNSGRFNYELGRVYAALSRGNEALAAYHKAVDLGYVRAQWALGYHDLYVPPGDPVRGKETLERAAAAGDVYAIHSLGQIYYEGRGVPKDLEKAKSLFETAARMGHTFSMNSLGRMYQRGETVPVNPVLARRYWEESAARGDIYGMDNLGFVYLEGIDAQKDPVKALSYFKQASDLGHPEAPNNIGRMYVLGIGTPINYNEARQWYRIGADRGDAWAAYNLGELFRLGKGGPKDDIEAGYYYARGAGFINRVEPSDLARKQLASLDESKKSEILRLLLRDIDPTNENAPDASLIDIARRVITERHITPTDASANAAMIGVAQAMWLARSARADLF